MSQISFPDRTEDQSRSSARLRPIHQQRSFASLRSITALVLREMTTTYGRSAGGYFWAIAEPVGGIILLTALFSLGFRSPPIGTNFAIFYATGVVPFVLYMRMSSKVAQAIRYSRSLLAYPAVTFADALLARIFLNSMTQILVAYIVFTGILMTQDTRTDPQILGIALSFLMVIVLSVGVGSVNCFLFSAFPWWQSFWSILNRPMFIISGVFFIYDDVPEPFASYLWFNPLVHVIGQMRRSFYPSYHGEYVSPVYTLAVGLVLFAIGMALLHRYHRDLMNS